MYLQFEASPPKNEDVLTLLVVLKPQLKGCTQETRSNNWISLFNSEQAGLNTAGARRAEVMGTGGAIISSGNRRWRLDDARSRAQAHCWHDGVIKILYRLVQYPSHGTASKRCLRPVPCSSIMQGSLALLWLGAHITCYSAHAYSPGWLSAWCTAKAAMVAAPMPGVSKLQNSKQGQGAPAKPPTKTEEEERGCRQACEKARW